MVNISPAKFFLQTSYAPASLIPAIILKEKEGEKLALFEICSADPILSATATKPRQQKAAAATCVS